ncbi:MAG TPA: hypothetical protein CFH84_04265 [Sulfurimonas sp. UBA12504]|nr:MAG: hypothetical protein A2019_03230 [Sulfurimonas sp. GWF2_37_8]DAB30420.1 MAG TPA: hypothetical protein CFH84_04265 [Sulfurimonas sp. UBA12504]
MLLVSNLFANNMFIDVTFGKHLEDSSAKYKQLNNGNGSGYSTDETVFKGDIRIGYSFPLTNHILTEPSLGWGVVSGFGSGVNVNGLYSVEIPLLYQYEIIKYGVFTRYNYLSDIAISNGRESFELEDKQSYSLGLKIILESKNINFLVSYEFMCNSVYENSMISGSEYTYTKLDLEGGYLSLGIRFKF